MNKFILAIAFVAVAAGVASANKHSHRICRPKHCQNDHEGFEHEHQGLDHSDDDRFEHKHGGFHGYDHEHRRPHYKHHHHHHHHHNRYNHHQHPKSKRGHQHHGGRVNGAVGVAGIGGIREHDIHETGFEGKTHLGDRKSISSKKGFIAGEKKGIEGSFQHHGENENDGFHKHQVLNHNKLLISDQTTGVNDVDGFRHRNEDSESAQFAAGESKIFGAGSSDKINSEREFDHGVKGHTRDDESVEAGGAFIGGATGSTEF